MQKLEKLLYTTAEARAVIACGTTRLSELLAPGKLRARQLGHRTMIEAQSLHSLVNALPRVTTPAMQRRTPGGAETGPKTQEDEPGAAEGGAPCSALSR